MDKIIEEIERQIQRLQAAKQLLIDTRDPSTPHVISLAASSPAAPQVKRGRGRPRKHPLVPSTAQSGQATAA